MATSPRRLYWLLLVLTGGWGLSPQAIAAEWAYRAGALSAWQQVAERDEGDLLVEESGFMSGAAGALEHNGVDWHLGIDADFLRGSLDYEGATQLGAPLQTETDWEHRSVGAYFERRLHLPILVNFGGSLAYQERERDIATTSTAAGLQEDYRTVWLGVRGSVMPSGSTALEADLACAIDSSVDVTFGSEFDKASLSTKEHCRAGVAASIKLVQFGKKTLFLRPFADWERYPRTDSQRLTADGAGVGWVFLPETEFVRMGVTIGIRGRRQ